ncbi:aldehyde dehydrogenase family protein [Streptomyces boncukensis]|uniref:Aldehyde dehydrogenase family protein n=1 Tax=Streptomyces boncukensis TaxID=2711219 RepID=A0A6G4WYW2_9ACTN|nr:aldehyde dehydrogenase family protein [Streptomyces boncukensis]NGO69621.1 aldehyde dehydrogenase family protein [Streptomyces boncukensis]
MSYFANLALQYIDGAWRPGTGSWDLIDFDPYSGEKLAAVTVATADEVDEAYRAAGRAQRGWAGASGFARRTICERAVRLIEERAEELADALVTEAGTPRVRADFELGLAKECLREAGGLAMRPHTRLLPSPVAGKENQVHHEPVGVVGVISPFHYPFLMALTSVAPALALGNAVVLKPHQNTPVCGGTLVAKLLQDAGLPAGLLNVLLTDIAEIGDALIEHPAAQVISFTGSDKTARHIAAVAAGHFKRTVLELNGDSAFVVCEDADLPRAAEAAAVSRFVHQGQGGSTCVSRILVHHAVEREFTEAFVERVRELPAGDPRDPKTRIGPLLSPAQADAVALLTDQAAGEGARVLLRGAAEGSVVRPTVLAGLDAGSPLLRQEIFGPVAAVLPFEADEEAVRLAGGGVHTGLGGAVHTADLQRGMALSRRLRSGVVHVNGPGTLDEPSVPFGGQLRGEGAWAAFTTQRWVSVQRGRTEFPF